eukprot:m.619795 g.619795  ORF g.619795 m.619795 type:complete len:59 (-) comp58205_c0_seq11:344-520(-)
MVHMKRRFNWALADVLYKPRLNSHLDKVRSWRNVTVIESPSVASLPAKLQVRLFVCQT